VALNWLKTRLAAAQATDIVFLAYVTFSGVLFAAFGWKFSPGIWIGLTLAHIAMVALGLWLAGQPLRYPSLAGFVRDAYPILLVVFLYWELRYLALLFGSGYNDPLILRLEEVIFGEQLAMTFSQRLPYLWLSELMHSFYALYWILLPMALFALYFRGKAEGFRELVYVETIVFFGCYLAFIFFPVQGPHYEFPVISGPLADGFFYKMVHWVLADGGSKGAAFPSSHVAVAVAILLVTWRHDRVVFAVMAPLVIGLTIGTVYGRFHYGMDATSGVLAGVILFAIALYLRGFLERFSGSGPAAPVGNSPGSPAV
jgi:membrane-associated phospholipid phosphatase